MALCTPVTWDQLPDTDDENDFTYTDKKMKLIKMHEPRLFTRPCNNLRNFGYCKYNEKCHFKHEYNHDEQIDYHYGRIKHNINSYYKEYNEEPDEVYIDDFEEQKRIFQGRKSITKMFRKLSESESESKSEPEQEPEVKVDTIIDTKDRSEGIDDKFITDYREFNPVIDEHLLMLLEDDEEAMEMFDLYISNEKLEHESEFEEFYLENKMVSEYYDMVDEFFSNIQPLIREIFGIYPISIDFGMNVLFI